MVLGSAPRLGGQVGGGPGEVAAELAAEDEFFAEVWGDLAEFREGYNVWNSNIYLPRPRK